VLILLNILNTSPAFVSVVVVPCLGHATKRIGHNEFYGKPNTEKKTLSAAIEAASARYLHLPRPSLSVSKSMLVQGVPRRKAQFFNIAVQKMVVGPPEATFRSSPSNLLTQAGSSFPVGECEELGPKLSEL
jgi:hypothetical protein